MFSILNAVPDWMKGVAVVWFPIGVAMFLLLQQAGIFTSAVDKHTLALVQFQAKVEARMDSQERKQYMLIQRLTLSLQVLCENSAKTIAERNNCLNIRGND